MKAMLLSHSLTMSYIRPFLYDIINVSLRSSECYITKYIAYNTKFIGAFVMTTIQFVL